MRKITNFLVGRRLWIFIAMLAFAVAGAVLIFFVTVNDDMSKYLPSNSNMKQGLEIMNEEIAQPEQPQYFKLMFTGLKDFEKSEIKQKLSKLEHVESVEYEEDSADYNNGEYTLYVVHTDLLDAAETDELISGVKDEFSDFKTAVNFDNTAESVSGLMAFIMPIAIALVIVIMLALCNSFIEPVLIMATLGVAILINMGTNVIFPYVSNITFSIAVIMQLILSIDYSVILFNRYSQERKKLPGDKVGAMKNTLVHSMGSILGSSVTTFAGLMALLFMSFTIGLDMGLVLAKGVLFSLVCVFTVLPALILWCDGLIKKTDKAAMLEAIKRRKSNKKVGGGD